jgi:LDH2 family malate/lactate/ureidoglycolate dehydrogenase
MLPGENAHRHYLERRRTGLEVDAVAWEQIGKLALELEVEMPNVL